MTNVSNVFSVPQFQTGPEWSKNLHLIFIQQAATTFTLCVVWWLRGEGKPFSFVSRLWDGRISSKYVIVNKVFDINNILITLRHIATISILTNKMLGQVSDNLSWKTALN